MGYVPPMRPRAPWPPPPAAFARGSGNLPRVGPTCPDYYPPPPVESDEQTIARYIGGNEGRFFIEDDAYILGRRMPRLPAPPRSSPE